MKIAYYFLIGFLIAFSLHGIIGSSCLKENSTGPDDSALKEKINKAAANIESIMQSGDTLKLIENLTPTILDLYKGKFNLVQPDMAKFAESFKSRQLVANSDIYAEFSFVEGGETYIVSLALQEDGSWKLMNF